MASASVKPAAADYVLTDVENRFLVFHPLFIRQFKDVRWVYKKAKNSLRFNQSELDYLGACLNSFLMRYSKCLALYKNNSVKTVFFIVHYLNEGLIAAMDDLEIENIELQHGLISSADLYYAYDSRYQPWIQNAFFPKKMWVYGEFWGNRVKKGINSNQQQITIAGDYTLFFEKEKTQKEEKENMLLICTQKFLENDYYPWIDSVLSHLEKYPDWRVVIKLHPKEREHNIERYKKYASDKVEVILQGDLSALFAKAKIQLSIYSTTLYDSIGYGVVNFALVDAKTHITYIQEIVDQHVALPIHMAQDPISLLHKSNLNEIERNMIYDSFPSQELEKWLADWSSE